MTEGAPQLSSPLAQDSALCHPLSGFPSLLLLRSICFYESIVVLSLWTLFKKKVLL